MLATLEPHPRTDFLTSLETSGQAKLFRVARQDDETIRTRPDLIIRIFRCCRLRLLVCLLVVVWGTIFDQVRRNVVTAFDYEGASVLSELLGLERQQRDLTALPPATEWDICAHGATGVLPRERFSPMALNGHWL